MDRGRCWTPAGKAMGAGQLSCCFSLALLSGLAIFALFQCSSAFQHSNKYNEYRLKCHIPYKPLPLSNCVKSKCSLTAFLLEAVLM
jgi:hypothetical protein